MEEKWEMCEHCKHGWTSCISSSHALCVCSAALRQCKIVEGVLEINVSLGLEINRCRRGTSSCCNPVFLIGCVCSACTGYIVPDMNEIKRFEKQFVLFLVKKGNWLKKLYKLGYF